LRPLAKIQRLSKDHIQHTIDWSLSRVNIMTDIENEKLILPPLKLMTRNEVMNDLLKLLDLVQKHADKKRCQHCLNLLESVFEH
jgi:phage gp16-like protein